MAGPARCASSAPLPARGAARHECLGFGAQCGAPIELRFRRALRRAILANYRDPHGHRAGRERRPGTAPRPSTAGHGRAGRARPGSPGPSGSAVRARRGRQCRPPKAIGPGRVGGSAVWAWARRPWTAGRFFGGSRRRAQRYPAGNRRGAEWRGGRCACWPIPAGAPAPSRPPSARCRREGKGRSGHDLPAGGGAAPKPLDRRDPRGVRGRRRGRPAGDPVASG